MSELSQSIIREMDIRCHNNARRPVLVEVGAADPDYLSISSDFRSQGWHIIAIEPNPQFCELHKAKGYDVLQYACGERDEDNVSFCVVDSHGTAYGDGNVSFESFSSFSIKDSYRGLKPDLDTRTIQVQMRRLDTILHTHAEDVQQIDALSIDVEGWEMEVLRGFSIDKYKPTFMIIENLFNDPTYRSQLADAGYGLWKYLPPNDIYLRRSEAKLRDVYGMTAISLKSKASAFHKMLVRNTGA